ncbi:hypothetical protein HaLaN_18713, partial [Haematococcus lacustris]
DLRHRVVAGRHVEALAIVYLDYWDANPSVEDLLERLEAVKQLYCQQACLSDGTEVPHSPGMGISQLWQSLSEQPITALGISAYGRLAELAMISHTARPLGCGWMLPTRRGAMVFKLAQSEGDWCWIGNDDDSRHRDQPRHQPCDGPGPFVTSISLA